MKDKQKAKQELIRELDILRQRVADMEQSELAHRRAEEELREKTRLNQILLDAFPCVAFLLRPESREIVASNAAAVKVGALPGTHCYSTWGQRQDPCPWCLAPTLWGTGEAQHLEVEALGITWDAHWIPIAEDLYMHFAFDITEWKRAEEKLRKSEEKYSILVENAGEAIFVAQEGMLKFVNPRTTEMSGYSLEELTSRPFTEFIHLDDRALVLERYTKRLQGEVLPSTYAFRIIHRSGDTLWVELNVVLIDWGGKPATLNFLTDITERKRAQEALRRSKEELRLTLDATTDGIWKWNFMTNELYFSPRYYTVLGYEPDEFPPNYESWQNLIHPDDLQSALGVAEKYLKTKPDKYENEFRLKTKDGGYRWIRTRGRVAERSQDGNALLLIGNHEDITERKRAEEALRETNDKLTRAQRVAHIGSWEDYLPTNELHWSEEMYNIIGFPPNTPINLVEAAQVFPPEELERFQQAVSTTINEDAPYSMDYKIVRLDGSVRYIHDEGEVIRDEHGRAIWMFGTTQDITEWKRLEGERLEMERRLQYSQRLESLGVLAGGLAHDFNNILMAIMGNLEMAQMNLEASSKPRRYIEAAFKASRRAAEITRQMLAYSGRGAFVVKPTDLSAVVDEMGDLLRSSISKTVSLQFNLCRSLPSVTADSEQMEQIIMNMVINASEAIGEGASVVTVRTGVEACEESYLERSRVEEKPSPGRFVFLEVSDTGCGMDEETQRCLFDPFFTTKFTGRGLGMSAVVGIVRGHKGAIVVESEVGRGTTIRVLFPAPWAGGEEARPREEAVSVPSGEGVVGGFSGTVLVVDDEEAVCDLCREELEGFGFTVLTAEDGEEGVRVFREHGGEITCVILDFMMPKMDGVAAFKELTRIRPDVRVILSSGYDQQEALRLFAGQGLSGFIQKPYTMANLRDTLRLALPDRGEQILK
jgi:PAS domain S-box-containing protein